MRNSWLEPAVYRRRLSLAVLAGALLLNSCTPSPLSVLQGIRQRGQLTIVTLNRPTTYYLGAHGPEGYEYRLAAAFAAKLGVQLVILQARSATVMRETLAEGSADLAAAQITATNAWKRVGLATVPYQKIPQLVVQRRGRPRPNNIADLKGARLVVRADSAQLQLLHDMRGGGAPYLSWTELPREQADPLDWVSSGDADFAIIDANEYEYAQHLFPDIIVSFTLPDPRPIEWMVGRDALDLRDAANTFLAEAASSGLLARLEHESEQRAHGFQYEEARRYQDDLATRLPALRSWFEEAASTSGLDWRLLAAVGYQESKWDAAAKSGDGAAGVMMLTADTAESVGVQDRNDPRQNILGGAAYLAQVVEMIPERIAEPDRTWLALAAYNVGYGHLEDARILTQSHGKNPDAWADVSQFLPLLADEQWYSQAKRGYARGWEPVKFVEEVRGFLAVLEWFGNTTSTTATAAAATSGAPVPKKPLQ